MAYMLFVVSVALTVLYTVRSFSPVLAFGMAVGGFLTCLAIIGADAWDRRA